jgi:hypothetical protein
VRDLEAGFGSVFTFTLRGDADTARGSSRRSTSSPT